MRESGYYPPGTEFDPRAPWNQPEPVECPDCHGSGEEEAPIGSVGTVCCSTCGGVGVVSPEDIDDEGPDPDDLRDAQFDREMDLDDRY